MTVMIIISSVQAMAAPKEISGDIKSTSEVLWLSKPEDNISTFSTSCIISGVASPGAVVTVYIQTNEQIDKYEKLIIDNEELSWEVGPSGMFVKEITLKSGKVNRIMIYAEKDEVNFQVVKREITVKESNLKELIRNGAIKLEEFINKIFSK
jgi:hypothetical protein